MPLINVSFRRGKSPRHIAAIGDGIYQAMIETFNVPINDRFILMHQHEDETFDCDAHYQVTEARTREMIIIQIICANTRSLSQKKAFFKRIVERLGNDPGLQPQDIFINLVETAKENWSFGYGVAQYA